MVVSDIDVPGTSRIGRSIDRHGCTRKAAAKIALDDFDVVHLLHTQVVVDPSDPKLAHLDGLNLSRAWMLEGIASGLPKSDPRVAALRKIAAAQRARWAKVRAEKKKAT